MRPPAPRYRVRPSLRLSESGFLIDLSNGESYTLNGTGQLIVRSLIEGQPSDEVFHEVVLAFAVTPARAQHDVERYLVQLAQLALVEAEVPS